MTHDDHFNKLNKTYDDYQRFLLKKGRMLFKDTKVGIWGVTPLAETYELFKLLNIGSNRSFIDIGSGDGRIVLLASIFGLKSHGVEFDPALVNSSIIIRNKLGLPQFVNTKFLEADFMDHDLSSYDLVYSSPDKPFHRKGLDRKLEKELKGTLIVHGWEFHPSNLQKKEEHVINGEKFLVYSR